MQSDYFTEGFRRDLPVSYRRGMITFAEITIRGKDIQKLSLNFVYEKDTLSKSQGLQPNQGRIILSDQGTIERIIKDYRIMDFNTAPDQLKDVDVSVILQGDSERLEIVGFRNHIQR